MDQSVLVDLLLDLVWVLWLVCYSINLNQTVLWQPFNSIAHSRRVLVLLEILSIHCVELKEEPHISQEYVSLSHIIESQTDTSQSSLEIFHDLMGLPLNLLSLDVSWLRVDGNLAWNKDSWSHDSDGCVGTDSLGQTFREVTLNWFHWLIICLDMK